MVSDNTLLMVAIIAVAVALGAFLVTMNVDYALNRIMLAPTDTGRANVTIQSNAEISFTTDLIDWGTGATPSGQPVEMLDTNSSSSPDVSAPGAYWNRSRSDNGNGGFVLENIGNVDVTLSLNSQGGTASTYIGGTGPEFGFKIVELDGANVCSAGENGFGPGWLSFTGAAQAVRSRFNYEGPEQLLPAQDRLEIHIHIGVPDNAPTSGPGGNVADIIASAVANP